MDEAILYGINRGWSGPLADHLFTWASARFTFSYPLLLLLLADSVRRAGWRGARLWLLLVVSVGIGDSTGNTIKSWVEEPRPCFDRYAGLVEAGGVPMKRCSGPSTTGMPSNHALNFFVAVTFLTVTTSWRGWQVGIFIAALLASLSRVYLGKHLPSQVLAGSGIGAVIGLLAGLWACYHRACIPPCPAARFFRRETNG